MVDLKDDPIDFCILPNENILFANYFSSKDLTLYDQNFIFIKNITKINDYEIRPFSLETNKKDRIYINNFCKTIIMTDLDFNYLNEFGSNANEIIGAFFMLFHNQILYICDIKDKFIIKLDSYTLQLKSKIYLDIKPAQIQIINNLASITCGNSIYFYDIIDFNLKHKYDKSAQTTVLDHKFLCIVSNQLSINTFIFNKYGNINESITFNHSIVGENNENSFTIMKAHTNKLFVKRGEKKMLLF